MNFDQDIRDHVFSTLPYEPAQRAELELKSTPELLIVFLNWLNRLIPARPRSVHRSQALDNNPVSTARKSDLDQIVSKIMKGDDLTPHLSKRVEIGYESRSSSGYGRRRDLDLMLNEWQVHHLHLANTIGADGFVTRDDPLLFAAFRPDEAYLIGIFGHSDWTREDVANILIDEWPGSGFVRELPHVIGLSGVTTEKNRALARSSGINAPFMQRNGKVYMIGVGGITSAGTAVTATRYANYIRAASEAFVDFVTTNPQVIAETLEANGIALAGTPDLHLAFETDGTCYVSERKTGARLALRIQRVP